MKLENIQNSNDFQSFLEDKYSLNTISYWEDGREIYNEFELYNDIKKLLAIRTKEVLELAKQNPNITPEEVDNFLNGDQPAEV